MKLTAYKHLQIISVIGVMALILTRTISGNDGSDFYQILEKGYTFQFSNKAVKTYETIKDISVLNCAMYCMSRDCKSFNYKPCERSCQTFHIWKDNVAINGSKNKDVDSFTVYDTSDDKWIKMYSFLAGSGVNVTKSYMGIGNRLSWKLPEECIQYSCSSFFRSHLIDTWETLPPHQVKLVIYKTGKPAVTMTFHGRNSTKTNWFTHERRLSSPWNDLTNDTIRNFNLTEGGAGPVAVDSPSHMCIRDYGWLCITERKLWCYWEYADSYPYTLFSNQTRSTDWIKAHGVGDSMAIFIKLI